MVLVFGVLLYCSSCDNVVYYGYCFLNLDREFFVVGVYLVWC